MNMLMRALGPLITGHDIKSFSLLIGSLLIRLRVGTALALPDDRRSPLAPLAKDEILTVVQILKEAGKVTTDSRFSLITLFEPSKREVLDTRLGSEPDRK